jgi:DNA repair protein RecN (Recombination protein N)
VDLHQQFDTLELGDSDFQREVLDALAGNESILKEYRVLFQQWQQSNRELSALQQQKTGFQKELDYNQFLYDELETLSLKENELEELDQELQLLSNAEGIKTTLNKAYFDLREREEPLVQQLKQMIHALQGFTSFHPDLAAVVERLQSSQIELQDIAGELEHINDGIQYDAKRIEWINQRMADGYKLLKKHGLQSTTELLQLQEALAAKLKAVLDIDDAIAQKEKESATLLVNAEKLAVQLSKARQKQAEPLAKEVTRLLTQVGMPNARLQVQLETVSLNADGKDAIEFLFDANKSNRFEPIRKVASGGELSRLMLCIKSLVAASIDLPTMIFDEIDTGISGEAAKQVGLIMKEMAANRQIICITHQPQIAGKANAHFFVYKEIRNDAVKTNIRLLNDDERITAIARMLSGEKPTAAAIENAREMMN